MDPKLLAILQANDELELSLADLEPAPVPEPVQDPVPPEASQPAIPPPPATGGEAKEKPRRYRRRGAAAPTEGGNGQGEPDLAEVFLLTGQVAGLLHMHPNSVLRIVARGDLPGIKIGGRLLVPAEALDEFLASRRVPIRRWAMRRNGRSQGSM